MARQQARKSLNQRVNDQRPSPQQDTTARPSNVLGNDVIVVVTDSDPSPDELAGPATLRFRQQPPEVASTHTTKGATGVRKTGRGGARAGAGRPKGSHNHSSRTRTVTHKTTTGVKSGHGNGSGTTRAAAGASSHGGATGNGLGGARRRPGRPRKADRSRTESTAPGPNAGSTQQGRGASATQGPSAQEAPGWFSWVWKRWGWTGSASS